MSDIGIGNGYSFALMGYTCPLHTLHSMIGPTYQKNNGFFPDVSWFLSAPQDSKRGEITRGTLFRTRHTPIAITQEAMQLADNSPITLETVTFAPIGTNLSPMLQKHVIVQILIVRNTGKTTQKALFLHADGPEASRGTRKRTLFQLLPETKRLPSPHDLTITNLAPQSESVIAVAYVMTEQDTQIASIEAALAKTSVDALLNATKTHWKERFAQVASVQTPDQKVNDMFTGLLMTIWTQQAAQGGVSPMSRYTKFWTRDSVGPIRLWSKVGAHQDMKALLQYYHRVAGSKEQLQNSYTIDLPASQQVTQPDWDALPVLSGRTAAEAPSYLPIMMKAYLDATGDDALLKDAYPMLKHAIFKQQVSPQGRLPFSGDETYRSALSMTLGWAFTFAFEECCDSANSSFLLIAGARALASLATHLNKPEDAKRAQQIAQTVNQATEREYRKQDLYLPFIHRKEPGNPPPYPEVSTKPLWLGIHDPNADATKAHINAMIKRMGKPDGFWQLPVHETYKKQFGLNVAEGIYMGMTPGYVLTNLSIMDHPTANALFNALPRVLSATGNVAEYQLYADHSVFQFVYDKKGTGSGDITARYRPWEGGIVLDAVVTYLTGFAPDATNASASFAPRIPNGWNNMTWQRLRVGTQQLSMQVTQRKTGTNTTRSYQWTLTTGTSLTLHIELPLPVSTITSLSIDNATVPKEKQTNITRLGGTRLRLPTQTLTTKQPLVVNVSYTTP